MSIRETEQVHIPAFWSQAAILALCYAPAMASSPLERPECLVTDGVIYALTRSADTVYVGGLFSVVGPNTAGCALLDTNTGSTAASLPRVSGLVLASAPDGVGGWYIGGMITQVGPQPCSNLAHIRADGTVDPAFPGADDWVSALALSADGTQLYVGGYFGNVGGQPRANLAAIRTVDGAVTAWAPIPSGYVFNLKPSPQGDVLYAAGAFTSVAGQVRHYLAAFAMANGSLTSWNPDVDDITRVLTVSSDGSTIYVGGRFQSINGQTRHQIAALTAATGAPTAFDPRTSGSYPDVFALALDGNVLYVGGTFTHVGGLERQNLAALSATTGDAQAWNPSADGAVQALAVDGGAVYAGGDFYTIGGQSRWHIAAIDGTTGEVVTWAPSADAIVYSLTLQGQVLMAGGGFKTIAAKARASLAAFNSQTGAITTWSPSADDLVQALAVSGDGATVYAGGNFSQVNGTNCYALAALDADTGSPRDWHPFAAGDLAPVQTIAISGPTVYLGGRFTSVSGIPRHYLAALSAANASLLPWTPQPDNYVSALVVSGGKLYAGGDFTQMAGQPRGGLAEFRLEDGGLTAWNPASNGSVYALAVTRDVVYAGGGFSRIGTQLRNRLAALDRSSGQATSWNPDVAGTVLDMELIDDGLFLAGEFSAIGGQVHQYLARVDINSGQADAWSPAMDARVTCLTVAGTMLYAGGEFTTVDTAPRNSLAGYTIARWPSATPSSLTVAEDAPGTGTLGGIDYAGAPLTFSIVDQGGKGTAVITDPATGAFSYTPAANSNGSDAFTFQVSNGSLSSTPAQVEVAITPVNDPPVAVDGTLTAAAGVAATGTLHASDVDGETLHFAIVSQGAKGTAVLTDSQGTFSYMPFPDGGGTDSFSFRASDASSGSNIATVHVSITAAPADPPPTDDPGQFRLTTSPRPAWGGTVSATPQRELYAPGVQVSLVATPKSGFAFVDWEGDAAGSSDRVELTMSGDKSVTAVFTPQDLLTRTFLGGDGDGIVLLGDSSSPRALVRIHGTPGAPVTVVMLDSDNEPIPSFAGFIDDRGMTRALMPISTMAAGDFIAAIEMYYSVTEIGDLQESDLRLFRWSDAGSRWELAGSRDLGVAAPSSGLGDYGVDTSRKCVWAVVDRFGRFAVGKALVQQGGSEPPSTVQPTTEQPPAEEPTQPPPVHIGCGSAANGLLFTLAGLWLMRPRRPT